MSRSVEYRYPFTAANGWECALRVRPSHDTQLGLTPTVVTVAKHAFLNLAEIMATWQDLPIGWQEISELKLEADLYVLERAGGAQAELAGYISDPIYAGGSFPYTSASSTSGFTEAFFDTSNLFTLEATLPGDADPTVLFEGVQMEAARTFSPVRGASCIVEISLESIHSRCLSVLDWYFVGWYMWNNPDYDRKKRGRAYDWIYQSGSVEYVKAFTFETDDDTPFQWGTWYTWVDLYDTLELQLDQIYQSFTRTKGSYADRRFRFYSPFVNPAEGPGMHIDYLALYKSDYTKDQNVGAQLGRSGLWLIGTVHMSDQSDTWTNYIGGTLALDGEGGQSWFSRFGSIKKFMQVDVEAKGIRARMEYVDANLVAVRFEGLDEVPATRDLEREKINSKPKVVRGGEGLVGCAVACQVTMSGSGDATNPTARNQFNDDEGKVRTITAVTHNIPIMGDPSNRFYMQSWDEDEAAYNPDFTGDVVCVASSGFPLEAIWYFDAPSGQQLSAGALASSIPIRVNDLCTIITDSAAALTAPGARTLDLPTPPIGDVTAGDDETIYAPFADAFFLALMRSKIKQVQETSGVLFKVASLIAQKYRVDKCTSLPDVELDIESLDPRQLGELRWFTVGGVHQTTLNKMLSDTSTILNGTPAKLQAVSISTSLPKGSTKATLLGVTA